MRTQQALNLSHKMMELFQNENGVTVAPFGPVLRKAGVHVATCRS